MVNYEPSYMAKDVEMLKKDEVDTFLLETVEISKMLQGIIGRLGES